MKLGVVGLPNVGKSTLFNAITKAGAEAANYPFCTIEPNTGVVAVPDERLNELSEMYHPKKTTPAVIEFVDIAGLVKGASHGEGLGNKFLSHIRECEAIVHVVRCFEDPDIIRHADSLNPQHDIETINLELIAADRETVAKRAERAVKMLKSGEKRFADEAALGEKLLAHLDNLQPARTCPMTDKEREIAREWFLLTTKPVIYACNIKEDDLGKDEDSIPGVTDVKAIAAGENAKVLVISAKIEEDIAQMDDEEKNMFLEEMGIGKSGLDRLIAECYDLLGLISFLTAGLHPRGDRFFQRFESERLDDRLQGKGTCPQRRQGLCDAGRRCDALPLQRLTRETLGRCPKSQSGTEFPAPSIRLIALRSIGKKLFCT